ncbi:hypothetical protein RN607_04040 [Demequina capsici]|uniref:Uncharacterized protein n=1 Tax=Demequina capsici TaxID=3075620 RepID=A0AA96FGP6_9MICO|nr:hypothetical protein [Demequina sp. PMTSA13]WNM28181.1 hypothetical protein RN607_04040 [Demequina sp. PMTSA13]
MITQAIPSTLDAAQWLVSAAGSVDEAPAGPSALPMIAAVAIGLPMVGVLVGFVWVKIRDRDDPAGPVLRPGRDARSDDGSGADGTGNVH